MEYQKVETKEQEPELITIAKDILNYRISTSSNETYKNWKYEELEKLEKFNTKPIEHTNQINGILGEAIILDLIKGSEIDIKISSGDEDLTGIDFYFGGFPIDVTTNPTNLNKKVDTTRLTTLYLPKYLGQDSILKRKDHYSRDREYVLRHLIGDPIPKQSYLYDLMSINIEILKTLREELYDTERNPLLINAGSNNERNLATILKIIINSDLWPASKNLKEI